MRLIDADEIEQYLEPYVDPYEIPGVLYAISYVPSAEPEIIRCKDCKHVSYEPCKDYENVYVCNRTTFTRMNGGNVPDAFCSYAERIKKED